MSLVTIDNKQCEIQYHSESGRNYASSDPYSNPHFNLDYKGGSALVTTKEIIIFNIPLLNISHDGDFEHLSHTIIQKKADDVKEFFDLLAYISNELQAMNFDVPAYMQLYNVFDEKYLYEGEDNE